MQDFNLFEAEDQLAQECHALLDGGKPSGDTAAALAKLLAGYEHLLRETKQLVRLSDRREKDMNRLNKKLEQLTHWYHDPDDDMMSEFGNDLKDEFRMLDIRVVALETA